MTYTPNPIDTSHIRPDASLRELIERLAENVHDVWAKQRMDQGWTHGPERDDGNKRHPCLVAYQDLPESEKEYDRSTAMETIKSILSLGYRIQPPECAALAAPDPLLRRISERLCSPSPISLPELHGIWEKLHEKREDILPDIHCRLAERIIRVGEPLLAYDVLSKALKHFPGKTDPRLLASPNRELYVRLRQLLALALAQSGATDRASGIVSRLYEQGLRDGETLGILGRTYKDIALKTGDREGREKKLAWAYGCYHEAYETAREQKDADAACYNGINAATIALFRGQRGESLRLAKEVRGICTEEIGKCGDKGREPGYWLCATMGEASLITGAREEAKEWYGKAARLAKGNFRDISSMRRQARLLGKELGRDRSTFDHCFPVPSVLVFRGTRQDFPEISPPDQEAEAREKIARHLDESHAGIGYVSPLDCADILFGEEMLKREGAELNIVLPLSKQDMREKLARNFPGTDRAERFERLAERATRVFELSTRCAVGNSRNFEFAEIFMDGAAKLRARWLDTEIRFVTFRDKAVRAASSLPLPSPEKISDSAPSRNIYSMLVADVRNYSKMDENQLLLFGQHFLPKAARVLEKYGDRIISRKTAGDGLFVIFRCFRSALDCAVDFRDTIAATDWEAYGLPEDLGIRISLDAGPVFSFHDPVSDQTDFCGRYVIRAARIEPITPPGEIYTSESFAALATSRGDGDIRFEYAGQLKLAKDYEIAPVYHVHVPAPLPKA